MNGKEWLQRLSALNQDNARGPAPHKPLLLLVVCDLAEEGKLSKMLIKDGDLAFRFSSYWTIVAPRRNTKPDVRLPFFHLRTEGVWRPVEADGRPAEDRSRTVAAEIEPSFAACLQDPTFRRMLREMLIARYFQGQERAALYELLGMPIPEADDIAALRKEIEPSEESQRKRDAKFAVRVLPAYDYTCALTRYRMIAVDGTTPLDAAHIHQFKRGGNNLVTNGLALSKTAHWFFDRGFWSITDDFKIIVAADRFEEAEPEAMLLKRHAGTELLKPHNLDWLPDREHIRWHRERHKF